VLSKIVKKSNNVCLINTKQDGKKVNEKCGATDTKSLADFVVNKGFDYGFAFDGDGDRVVMVDGRGRYYDGDFILYNLALNLKKEGKLNKSTVVGTSMTNMGCEIALQKEGINLERVDVGDKYIVDKLSSDNLSLGGESAGHIIAYDYTNTGDGVLTALIMLNMIKKYGIKTFCTMPQKTVNINCSKQAKNRLLKNKDFNKNLSQIEQEHNDYRILVRVSGTENKIRVMVEGENMTKIDDVINKVCFKVREFL
jgi:phosphoglucosamine mutase